MTLNVPRRCQAETHSPLGRICLRIPCLAFSKIRAAGGPLRSGHFLRPPVLLYDPPCSEHQALRLALPRLRLGALCPECLEMQRMRLCLGHFQHRWRVPPLRPRARRNGLCPVQTDFLESAVEIRMKVPLHREGQDQLAGLGSLRFLFPTASSEPNRITLSDWRRPKGSSARKDIPIVSPPEPRGGGYEHVSGKNKSRNL